MRSLGTGGYSDFFFLQTFYMGFALYVPAIAFQAGKQVSDQAIVPRVSTRHYIVYEIIQWCGILKLTY